MAGTIKRGWRLTKSSWQVLKLDKELATLPLLSILTTFVVLGLLAIATVVGFNLVGESILQVTNEAGTSEASATLPGWGNFIGLFIFYFVLTLIGNFFSGALIYGATERFRGGNPTVRSSLAGAKRRFLPLAGFSLLMTTVGLALQLLAERVPFAGRIAVWLVGAAWNIANIFAIPVIVLSDQNIKPLEATKESVNIIKKAWGESVVVNTGIALIGLFSFMGYVLISGALLGLLGTQAATGFIVGGVVLVFIGLIALLLIFSTIEAIAKAALYHYAVTGDAPKLFDSELLHDTITRKKARKIFG